MKVFLSYATGDGAAADLITRWLDEKGVAFYDFRKPARHGGRFATSRPEAIAVADFFIAILSPNLLTSEWCRQDLDLGIQHEQLIAGGESSGNFVHVLQSAYLPHKYDGQLCAYDWMDLTSPRRAELALRELGYRLGIARRPTGRDESAIQAVIRRGMPASAAEPSASSDEGAAMLSDETDDKHKKVMVIYGHDTAANAALFDCLRAMGLKPQEWGQLIQQSQVGSPYIGAVLDEAFKNVQAVIAFFTPDEHVISRAQFSAGRWRLQARPNVFFEAGMAIATHPRETILVVLGDQELPSDLSGRHFIRLDGTSMALKSLSDRLRTAGCAVELDGNDWLEPGRFPNRDNIPANISSQRPELTDDGASQD